MQCWLSHVGVNQQNRIILVARQADGQIGRNKGLSLGGQSAADQDGLERSLIAKLIDLRAQSTKLLNASNT